MKILITSGPTREPIDGVRFITNLSTGETGKVLAEFFEAQGHEVTFLRGGESRRPQGCRVLQFETFQDLNDSLQKILQEEKYDGLIHAAAVGDYFVDQVKVAEETLWSGIKTKIDSSGKLEIILKRNFKILDRIKSYAHGPKPLVVGFKFTHTAKKDEWARAVLKLYSHGNIDLVVHNDLSERNQDKGPRFRLAKEDGSWVECESRQVLAQKLESYFKGEVK